MCLRQIGIDCNITLEKSRFLMPCTIRMIPRFILRLIFKSLNFSHGHLLSYHPFVTSATICVIDPSPLSSFFYRHSLTCSKSAILEVSKILLLDHFWLPFPLRCSARLSSWWTDVSGHFKKIYCQIQASPISSAFRCSFYERFRFMGSPWYFTVPGKLDSEG